MKLKQLSHTSTQSGGYRHEQFLSQSIADAVGASYEAIHLDGVFRGVAEHLKLAHSGYKLADAEINVVVARQCLGALMRKNPKENKVLLVMHNWDEEDGKGKALAKYYNYLWNYIRKHKPKNFALVCISSHWKTVFDELLQKSVPVLVFPNLIKVTDYANFQNEPKNNSVYLGQVSDKNDYTALAALDLLLKNNGFSPFYTSLYADWKPPYTATSVLNVEYKEYLKLMASSIASVSFPKVKEGWSRIAHESIILNTPVIGCQTGGLGQLLEESGSYIVSNAQEAFDLIRKGVKIHQNQRESFISDYDIEMADHYLTPIIDFLRQ